MSKFGAALDSATAAIARAATTNDAAPRIQGVWAEDEHDRFLEAMKLFPTGPWKDIAAHVGTRSVRQVQTHAQKYHEKVERRLRGLRKERKRLLRPEHRVDDDDTRSSTSSSTAATARAAPAMRGLAQHSPATCRGSTSSSSDSDMCKTEGADASEDGDSDRGFFLGDLDDHCLDYLLSVLAAADTSDDTGSLPSSSYSSPSAL